MRNGTKRILIGSTSKMGAGMNVQDKLIALHHLDCPWRPSDVGRILRTVSSKDVIIPNVSLAKAVGSHNLRLIFSQFGCIIIV